VEADQGIRLGRPQAGHPWLGERPTAPSLEKTVGELSAATAPTSIRRGQESVSKPSNVEAGPQLTTQVFGRTSLDSTNAIRDADHRRGAKAGRAATNGGWVGPPGESCLRAKGREGIGASTLHAAPDLLSRS